MASIELGLQTIDSSVEINTVENLQASRIDQNAQSHQENHIQVGQFLKSFIYGGLDGTINILCIIVSAVSSGQSYHTIMAVGIAATIGDAIGMGLGDYLSFSAEQGFIASERQRQAYEIDNMLEEELSQINQIFKEREFNIQDSKQLSKLFSQNKQIFLNVMMLHELGLVKSDLESWKVGLTNFFSFLVCGMLPIIPYIVGDATNIQANLIAPALMIGLFEFLMLGTVKAKVTHQEGWVFVRSVLEVAIFGSIIIVISYGLGFIFK